MAQTCLEYNEALRRMLTGAAATLILVDDVALRSLAGWMALRHRIERTETRFEARMTFHPDCTIHTSSDLT